MRNAITALWLTIVWHADHHKIMHLSFFLFVIFVNVSSFIYVSGAFAVVIVSSSLAGNQVADERPPLCFITAVY